MPTAAVTHIQKIAPGPPMRIAVATPPIFPLPTVEARAVDRAWNEVMEPSPAPDPGFARALPNVRRTASGKCRTWTKPVRIVIRRPTSTSTSGMANGCHTRPSRASTWSVRVCTSRSNQGRRRYVRASTRGSRGGSARWRAGQIQRIRKVHSAGAGNHAPSARNSSSAPPTPQIRPMKIAVRQPPIGRANSFHALTMRSRNPMPNPGTAVNRATAPLPSADGMDSTKTSAATAHTALVRDHRSGVDAVRHRDFEQRNRRRERRDAEQQEEASAEELAARQLGEQARKHREDQPRAAGRRIEPGDREPDREDDEPGPAARSTCRAPRIQSAEEAMPS